MKLTKGELVRLNRIISVAFMSGKIEMDEISESIHKKVTKELEEHAANVAGGE